MFKKAYNVFNPLSLEVNTFSVENDYKCIDIMALMLLHNVSKPVKAFP